MSNSRDKHDQQTGFALKLLRQVLVICVICMLTACGTVIQAAAEKVSEVALSAIGFKPPEKPELPDVPVPPKPVTIKLMAAQDMNAGDDGQGLSVIFRLYKLKSQNAFLTSPYAIFGSTEKEKEAMGTDIVEVKELTLSPGQIINLREIVPGEAGYVGVVALYRTPSPQRWRFAFPTNSSALAGITIGLHTCAMTATTTPPIGMTVNESKLLSPTKCQ